MSYLQNAYETQANTIIQNLKKRGMEGYYFPTSAECTQYILQQIPENSSVTWGGSESIKECGLLDAIKQAPLTLLDRSTCKTPEEHRQFYSKIVMADYFLMSTNAITLDGCLINIDGNGNRVACLINGPSHVYIIAGMNKVVPDEKAGIQRVRNFAAPPNAIRLNRQTPCKETGVCGNCLSKDCMCNHTVITRRSGHPGRIHVFLVGETLGY